MAERSLQILLELYEQGPDEETKDCRNCNQTMNPEFWKDYTVFCNDCSHIFLELLVERYKLVHSRAKSGWDVARVLAIMHDAPASEEAANKVLEELGDA